jgi:hypothetical protein
VTHLFFKCYVAQSLLGSMSKVTGLEKKSDFESMGKLWLRGKSFNTMNVCSSVVEWMIWKARNCLCFQGSC